MPFTRIGKRAALAAAVIGALVLTTLVVPQSASAATYALTAVRSNSGTSTVDAAGLCPAQVAGTPAHCAGYDTSLSAADQILRTGDTAIVRFDFSFSAADTGVVLRATLPLNNGVAAATWSSIPSSCASGSTRSDGNRTINCVIANPAGAGNGSISVPFLLAASADDGYTFTVPAQISSATSAVVTAVTTATFTTSSAPFWNISKTAGPITNTLPGPFFYRSATGAPGYAVPTSTAVGAGRVGGFSPLAGPVTWTETMTSAQIDVSGYRLLNWGNYGDGCASDGQGATPANPGYTNSGLAITNQVTVSAGNFDCAQPAGPGTPINVTWTNPNAGNPAANMWILLWVPAAVVPSGTTTPAPVMTASAFDPNDTKGVSNYIALTEPTTDNARAHGQFITGDNRVVQKRPIADVANPYASNYPAASNTTTRGGSFVSLMIFSNTGTVSQTPVQVCDVFDVTTQRLSPFATSALVPANTYAVATTNGPLSDPILSPPYQPAAGYNASNNWAVSTAAYTVEYAAGELGAAVPTTAPAAAASYTGLTCADASTATGWHSSPTDPAIAAYAATLGLVDPLDVVNRVRVTFTGAAVSPQQQIGIKLHMTTRSTYRAASSQAGQTIYATTGITDAATADYPQISIAHWTPVVRSGPVVAGLIGVNTAVDIMSVSPTNVQAGAPGQNRATYTVRASVAFGENVATTQPLRVVYSLPAGMRYVADSASRVPDHVLPQANGATVLVWDLGNITGATNTNVITPSWTFVGEADPLSPTPSTNFSTAISESVSPTGTALDQDAPTTGCGGVVQITIPPTPNVPVTTTTAVPTPADYSGCVTQGFVRRMDYQPLAIGSAFLNLAAYKSALAPLIESGADDGVAGALVGWNLVYRNTTSNSFPGVDIIDVLPYPGDGRSPASDFTGTVALKSLTTTDTMSPALTPNLLPVSSSVIPTRVGTTFYVTNRPPAQINWDPYDASNLQGGTTSWCVLGAASCTVTLAQATAVRIISGALATSAQRTVRLGFSTDGAQQGERMTNSAKARVETLTTPVDISGDSVEFAASSVAGTVWADTNADGVIDASESTRLANVSVRILGTATSGEAVDRTVTTASDGRYTFPGLGSGTYTLSINQATVRAINPGYALTADPDGATAPDGSYALTLPLGTNVTARDFGFTTSSLAGRVFGDNNNNGAIDGTESGTAGVTVTLTGTDDLSQPVSRTTTTDATGAYSFAGVRPGTYQLVETTPPGLLNGQNVAGTAGGTSTFGTSTIAGITLAAGQNGVGYLFGLLVPEIISGVVYEDSNDNGVQDGGESGIAGVTITLSGPVNLTTQTLADGQFAFAGLGPGTYQIVETQPAGHLDGTNATNGSIGTVSGDTISGIVVGTLDSTDSYSFGDIEMASITGVVYDDLNANGIRDPGEPGIAGAQVSLSGHAAIGPLTTGADGTYLFDGLEPGTYSIAATQATGYLDALEIAGTAGGNVSSVPGTSTITTVTLAVGQQSTGNLFGDVRAASLAGVVFEDTNGDGVQDAGESGISGVLVSLSGTNLFSAAVSNSMSTGLDGSYSFTGLVPGTYQLNEAQPVTHFDGIDSAGSAGGTVAADEVSGIQLNSGVAATGYLFAERDAVEISGFVFEDPNGNGVRDAGEAGIAGVDVEIQGPDDGLTTTDATGAWSFTGLQPGTYTVTEQSQPILHYVDGASVAGTAGGTVATNTISDIDLTSTAGGYLFAEIPMSVIRGTVWNDKNDDGVIDAGEPLLEGINITLSGSADRVAVTGADGTFVFGDLPVGTYTLTEEVLDNWSDGATVVGTAGGVPDVNTVTGIVIGTDVDASGYGFGERAASMQLKALAQTLDAQVAPGPYVPIGDPVRLGYVVTNTGDTDLENVVVTDDTLGQVLCPQTTLEPGADMYCLLETPSVAGQQMHVGSATADVVTVSIVSATLVDGQARAAAAPVAASASDPVFFFGMIATAEITTTVNGVDANQTPGPVFVSGQSLHIVVTVTNTGNVPLELDTLDFGGLGAFDCGSVVTIAAGTSIECVLDVTPPTGNFEFEVTGTFIAPDGTTVDGDTTPGGASELATLAFQVLEPAVALAATGVEVGWDAPATATLLVLLGATLVIVTRRWSRPEEPVTS